jgi:hypothetical protein
MSRTDHLWTDDALTGRGGWIAGIRWTCSACGVEQRKIGAVKDRDELDPARSSMAYFKRGIRVEGAPQCRT